MAVGVEGTLAKKKENTICGVSDEERGKKVQHRCRVETVIGPQGGGVLEVSKR